MLDYNGKPEFLIDASVFPGSSGSPVLLAPQIGSITRLGKQRADRRRVALLGMISSVAVQESTSEIKFVEIPTQVKPIVQYRQMIDLGIVIKADAIKQVIVEYLKKHNLPIEMPPADDSTKKGEPQAAT